jgi:hypothetical protein
LYWRVVVVVLEVDASGTTAVGAVEVVVRSVVVVRVTVWSLLHAAMVKMPAISKAPNRDLEAFMIFTPVFELNDYLHSNRTGFVRLLARG